ncbi:GFA family protein [Sphingobium chungbukense]|uniref:GFA family protein n=1 Tax=Sphingobium chungbukense TaxID=56193 RepID=UPI0009FCFA6C
MVETQCLCGEISLVISEEPLAQVYCHCSDCQIAQGAAYVLNSVYPADAVKVVSGKPITMAVKGTPRLRCASCGTPLSSVLQFSAKVGFENSLVGGPFISFCRG